MCSLRPKLWTILRTLHSFATIGAWLRPEKLRTSTWNSSNFQASMKTRGAVLSVQRKCFLPFARAKNIDHNMLNALQTIRVFFPLGPSMILVQSEQCGTLLPQVLGTCYCRKYAMTWWLMLICKFVGHSVLPGPLYRVNFCGLLNHKKVVWKCISTTMWYCLLSGLGGRATVGNSNEGEKDWRHSSR